MAGEINHMTNFNDLENRIENLDKLIDNYSILKSNSTNDISKKSYELIIETLLNQKVRIRQLICVFNPKQKLIPAL